MESRTDIVARYGAQFAALARRCGSAAGDLVNDAVVLLLRRLDDPTADPSDLPSPAELFAEARRRDRSAEIRFRRASKSAGVASDDETPDTPATHPHEEDLNFLLRHVDVVTNNLLQLSTMADQGRRKPKKTGATLRASAAHLRLSKNKVQAECTRHAPRLKAMLRTLQAGAVTRVRAELGAMENDERAFLEQNGLTREGWYYTGWAAEKYRMPMDEIVRLVCELGIGTSVAQVRSDLEAFYALNLFSENRGYEVLGPEDGGLPRVGSWFPGGLECFFRDFSELLSLRALGTDWRTLAGVKHVEHIRDIMRENAPDCGPPTEWDRRVEQLFSELQWPLPGSDSSTAARRTRSPASPPRRKG